jgi:hypothetical protein
VLSGYPYHPPLVTQDASRVDLQPDSTQAGGSGASPCAVGPRVSHAVFLLFWVSLFGILESRINIEKDVEKPGFR